jgi:hypothetical protein
MTETLCSFGKIWNEYKTFMFVGGANALNLLSVVSLCDAVSQLFLMGTLICIRCLDDNAYQNVILSFVILHLNLTHQN